TCYDRRVRGRGAPTLLLLALSAAAARDAAAQAAAQPAPGLVASARAAINQYGQSAIDQLDILWIENGRVYFSVGAGKIFGIDVRAAMGNPAALRPTTEVKWENFLADFNSRIVLLAAQYPGMLHPDGVALD